MFCDNKGHLGEKSFQNTSSIFEKYTNYPPDKELDDNIDTRPKLICQMYYLIKEGL